MAASMAVLAVLWYMSDPEDRRMPRKTNIVDLLLVLLLVPAVAGYIADRSMGDAVVCIVAIGAGLIQMARNHQKSSNREN